MSSVSKSFLVKIKLYKDNIVVIPNWVINENEWFKSIGMLVTKDIDINKLPSNGFIAIGYFIVKDDITLFRYSMLLKDNLLY